MAKVYDSSETNNSGSGETGRKGGSTAAALPKEGPVQQGNDYTGTTSEKSPAKYLVPILIAMIIFGSIFIIRARFAPSRDAGDANKALNATTRSNAEMRSNSTGANSAATGQ